MIVNWFAFCQLGFYYLVCIIYFGKTVLVNHLGSQGLIHYSDYDNILLLDVPGKHTTLVNLRLEKNPAEDN